MLIFIDGNCCCGFRLYPGSNCPGDLVDLVSLRGESRTGNADRPRIPAEIEIDDLGPQIEGIRLSLRAGFRRNHHGSTVGETIQIGLDEQLVSRGRNSRRCRFRRKVVRMNTSGALHSYVIQPEIEKDGIRPRMVFHSDCHRWYYTFIAHNQIVDDYRLVLLVLLKQIVIQSLTPLLIAEIGHVGLFTVYVPYAFLHGHLIKNRSLPPESDCCM